MGRYGKKGASAVMITLLLMSMIMACNVISGAAMMCLKDSINDSAVNLSCRSLLSEYDIRLKEDYGIFAYKGANNNLNYKLMRYVSSNTRNSFKPLNSKSVVAEVENSSYTIGDAEVVIPQIIDTATTYLVINRKGKKREKPVKAEKKISNEAMICGLPTEGKRIKLINIDFFDGEAALWDTVSENAMINAYIMRTFKNRFIDFPSRESFFNYEVEYILSGKMSEEESLEYVERQLFLTRLALNTAHIFSSPEKMAQISEYIAGLPPAAGAIEAAVIVGIWAASEAENDVKLLMDGKNVAFIKTSAQWSMSLLDAVRSIFSELYIEPVNKSGQSYEDYLKGLLYIQDKNTKVLRTMDLIQINLKSTYSGDFLIKDHYAGMSVKVNIDGRSYAYEHCY